MSDYQPHLYLFTINSRHNYITADMMWSTLYISSMKKQFCTLKNKQNIVLNRNAPRVVNSAIDVDSHR